MVLLNAQATATAIIAAKASEAEALKVALEQESNAYKQLIADLQLTPEQFVAWVWLAAVSGTSSPQNIVVARPDIIKSF